MLQQFSDLVKPALNKCSLSLGDGTDQPIRKKKRLKLKEIKNRLENDKALKCIKVF